MNVKIECLREPQLAFGLGKTGLEPRHILAKAGPADGGRLHEIQLALVGPAAEVAVARNWLRGLNQFRAAREGNSRRYRDWPGAPSALGVRFLIEDRFVRPLDQDRLNLAIQKGLERDGFEDLLELFDGRIQGLLGDGHPDCIMICLPEEMADLRVQNPALTPEERQAAEELRTQADDLLFRTFYRALKARGQSHVNPVPLQVLRRDTIERPDDKGHSNATRCWNLATSLYYKAGGLPWRPAELPDNVCFVGISFHHLKKRVGSIVYASVAQAFSTDVEPFTLRGATIDHQQREDRQPYLRNDQARNLLGQVIEGYEARAGVLPSRIVIHKTTTYHEQEEAGFREATRDRVPALDLIWLRSTAFRLIRKGLQEPWRGTLCRVGSENYLFTSGFVPWWNEYPGPHIPAPIQLGSAGETDVPQRAREVLALSKMNWNSTEGISRYPITLSFAKRVGQLMTELPEDQAPNPSYRFHM